MVVEVEEEAEWSKKDEIYEKGPPRALSETARKM
tara:strand:+ start:2251 stop:2352 length:102 start_codon:yes stop_codon:yes gene_type:complete